MIRYLGIKKFFIEESDLVGERRKMGLIFRGNDELVFWVGGNYIGFIVV